MRELDLLERDASLERALADAIQRPRQLDVPQVRAARERALADIVDRVGHGDGDEGLAVLKSALRDACDGHATPLLGDVDGHRRAAIAHDGQCRPLVGTPIDAVDELVLRVRQRVAHEALRHEGIVIGQVRLEVLVPCVVKNVVVVARVGCHVPLLRVACPHRQWYPAEGETIQLQDGSHMTNRPKNALALRLCASFLCAGYQV